MTLLHEAVDAKKFDLRVVSRNIERGLVTADQAKKVTETLPDDSENAGYINVEELADSEGLSDGLSNGVSDDESH